MTRDLFPFIVLDRTFDQMANWYKDDPQSVLICKRLFEYKATLKKDMEGEDRGRCKERLLALYAIGVPVELASRVFLRVIMQAFTALMNQRKASVR